VIAVFSRILFSDISHSTVCASTNAGNNNEKRASL
jgi:hypothetical protein